MREQDAHHAGWWLAILMAICLVPALVAAADDDEPELKGKAKKEHQAQVKKHMDYLLDRKTQGILEQKIRQVGSERTRAARDALIKFTIGRKSKRYVKVAEVDLGDRAAGTHADAKTAVDAAPAERPALRFPVWNAPVLSRGRLYLRGKDQLVVLDLAPAER